MPAPAPVPEPVYEALFDDAPPLPPRGGTREADAPPPPRTQWMKTKPTSARGSFKERTRQASEKLGWFRVLVILPLLFGLRVYNSWSRYEARQQRDGTAASSSVSPLSFLSGGGGPPAVTMDTPFTLPTLPPRGAGMQVEPGVMFQEIRIGPGHPAPGVPPGHGMTLYVYLPSGTHEPGSLPCVLIAPAGTNLLTGMELADGDKPEHLPYVRKGYAVVAYSLDGHLGDVKTDAQLKWAAETFIAARAGLTNAQVALEWVLARMPEVDRERLYTAGHSSAGTMALLLAENEPRIKKCAAFAAASNTETNFGEPVKQQLRGLIRKVDEVFTTYNPVRHVDQIRCPLLLVHARNDDVVSLSQSEAFYNALIGLGKQNLLLFKPEAGGHYDAMIAYGIPMAISWFSKPVGAPVETVTAGAAGAPPAGVARGPLSARRLRNQGQNPGQDPSAGAAATAPDGANAGDLGARRRGPRMLPMPPRPRPPFFRPPGGGPPGMGPPGAGPPPGFGAPPGGP